MSATPRLVAIDLDGTLCGHDDRIGVADARAVSEAARAGARIVIATGRAPSGCAAVIAQLNVPVGLVAVNGALVYETWGEPASASWLLPPPVCRALVDEVDAAGYTALVWDDPACSDAIFYPRPAARWPGFLDTQRERLWPLASPDEILARPALTVVAWGDETGMGRLVERLRDGYGEQVSLGLGLYPADPCWVLTITAAGCDKAVGVGWLAARHGIAPAEVLAIGDSLNDLGLLRWAGQAVAMGNACPEALALADWAVASQAGAGVAEALQRAGLTAVRREA